MCWKETIAIGTSGHLRLCPPNFVQSWVAIDCIILTILESHRSADYWCTWRADIYLYLSCFFATNERYPPSAFINFLSSFLRILLRTMQAKQTTHARRGTAAMLRLLEDVGQRLGMKKVENELFASINFVFCLINQRLARRLVPYSIKRFTYPRVASHFLAQKTCRSLEAQIPKCFVGLHSVFMVAVEKQSPSAEYSRCCWAPAWDSAGTVHLYRI